MRRTRVRLVQLYFNKENMTDKELRTNAHVEYVNGRYLIKIPDGETPKYLDFDGKEVDINTISANDGEKINEDNAAALFSKKAPRNIVNDIESHIRKYIYLQEEAEYLIISLIPLLSYIISIFERIPYFWLRADKGSGKTTLMSVLKPLVYHPVFVSNITPSSLFRIVDDNAPTLFMDEVEALASKSTANNSFIQILNSGYHKGGKVTRTHGNLVQTFKTYGLKILAGINQIAETVEDRCIQINLQKPTDPAEITPYTGQNGEEILELQKNIQSAILRNTGNLLAYLQNPDSMGIDAGIVLREYDKWMPMLAIAKVFSSKKNNYFEIVQEYALKQIALRQITEQKSPKNACIAIIKDFLTDFADNTKIADTNFFYFETKEILEVIRKNDPYNTYRNKAQLTTTLKTIGVETDRRRFGQGPVSLYKIPRTILN
jgi:hypothetical protein